VLLRGAGICCSWRYCGFASCQQLAGVRCHDPRCHLRKVWCSWCACSSTLAGQQADANDPCMVCVCLVLLGCCSSLRPVCPEYVWGVVCTYVLREGTVITEVGFGRASVRFCMCISYGSKSAYAQVTIQTEYGFVHCLCLSLSSFSSFNIASVVYRNVQPLLGAPQGVVKAPRRFVPIVLSAAPAPRKLWVHMCTSCAAVWWHSSKPGAPY
jgi:hypothetical protein